MPSFKWWWSTRPKGFVLENVPGMSASFVNGKRLPQALAEEFKGLGYFVTLMPLVATDYLVPQRRKSAVPSRLYCRPRRRARSKCLCS